MKQHRIPGVALKVIRDGKVAKTGTYGLANLELNVPVSAETVFEIGSITKQFTAAGILLLAQEGKLSVDDKISKYLTDTPEAWSKVTIRHLLTHTSGIKSYTGLDEFQLWRHLIQAQFIQAIGAQPMEFQPGESWKYCNTGFNLLGYIIENVSGMSYWDFMSQRVFQPLGMVATSNRLPSLIIPNRAAGYEQTNHVWINRDYDLTDVFSAGAIVSTVGDLAKWNASLDGESLLNAASKEQMWTPVRLNDGKTKNYGFGWSLGEVEGHKNIGHAGSTSGFSASIQRFPSDRLAVIILTNTDEEIATTLARKIAMFFFKDEVAKPASHTTRNIEGWKVHVDDRLLRGPDAELGGVRCVCWRTVFTKSRSKCRKTAYGTFSKCPSGLIGPTASSPPCNTIQIRFGCQNMATRRTWPNVSISRTQPCLPARETTSVSPGRCCTNLPTPTMTRCSALITPKSWPPGSVFGKAAATNPCSRLMAGGRNTMASPTPRSSSPKCRRPISA